MNVVVCMEGPVPGRASREALELATSLGAPTLISIVCATADGAPPEVRPSRANRIARLVLIQDVRLANAGHLLRAEVLARAARTLQASLILTGAASDAEGLGLVGAGIAHHLAWNYLARVESAELDGEFPTALLASLRSGGRLCRIQVPLPAVLSVAPGPPAPDRRRSATPCAPPLIEPLDLTEIGLDLGLFQAPGIPEGELSPFGGKIITAISAQDLADKVARIQSR